MTWIVLNIILLFQSFYFNFFWICRDRKSKLQRQQYWGKILKQYAKELKVKNSFSELGNDFIELKDREFKIKRELEELFFKPFIVSIDDMDKFEQNEIKIKTLGMIS